VIPKAKIDILKKFLCAVGNSAFSLFRQLFKLRLHHHRRRLSYVFSLRDAFSCVRLLLEEKSMTARRNVLKKERNEVIFSCSAPSLGSLLVLAVSLPYMKA